MIAVRKKLLALLLAFCALCACLLPAAAAQNERDVIKVKLNSAIAGLTDQDTEQLIELQSDNVVYRAAGAVSIADYAGDVDFAPVVAGRTYYISYDLSPAPGFTLPAQLEEGDVEITCEKGVTVYAVQVVTAPIRNDDGTFMDSYGLMINAKVVADGSILQRIAGAVYDLWLKLRAWSLY